MPQLQESDYGPMGKNICVLYQSHTMRITNFLYSLGCEEFYSLFICNGSGMLGGGRGGV